jgi:argininosuccinate lyase
MTQQTWSQRFESALHPAIARFNASISFDIELIEYDITVRKLMLRCWLILESFQTAKQSS